MANITRKQIINVLDNEQVFDSIACALDYDENDIRETINKMIASVNRPKTSKPSKETLRNREIARELAAEINARGIEMTAAEVADVYSDPDGMPLSPRKVGALLKQAAAAGLIEVSPEKWSVKHYGPVGFEFEKKPVRAAKVEETEEVDE